MAMMLPLKAESSCKPCNPQRTPISAPAIAVSTSIEQVYLILRDYQQLVSTIGSAIGIAGSEPNQYGTHTWSSGFFGLTMDSRCTSVVCD
ncbi:hypothetical protein [Nostoc sp. UHCC 0251]|uniref:hypothetical protein n=1 Tax=Nostoc sp. UHCC 0251 TaxID=3110240 RepID=UPI002B214C5C|nr:hypothetical protein [Nostoc sp. UHCC 0251]MEA5624643.1 hypothetical protein [Nostoc sp. UHCC 0251]